MLRCLKGLYILALWWLSGLVLSQPSYESCWSWTLRDEWYIVMKAYLLVYNFDILRFFGIIIIILCVRAIPMIWIVHAMPQTRGVSPYSQAGFGVLTASQLCITHKPIEAYPLQAMLVEISYSLSHTIGTLEGETRIFKNPVKCVDDSSYLGKTNNHTINYNTLPTTSIIHHLFCTN